MMSKDRNRCRDRDCLKKSKFQQSEFKYLICFFSDQWNDAAFR
jgi:hypothetical protein